jgi:hypothetical protein
MGADLSGADLSGAHLMGANFHDANLAKANLSNANLTAASLVSAKIEGTILSNCSVYGVSAFNLEGAPKNQSNLVITSLGESPIAVSDLESAQFVYLLISGRKVPQILESVNSRLVLVLGNFKAERKGILRSIEVVLQRLKLTSIVAHFSSPIDRGLIEKVLLLAKFVRFMVADPTESKPLQRFLHDCWTELQSVPVHSIIQTAWSKQDLQDSKQIPDTISECLSYSTPEDLRELLEAKLKTDDSLRLR